MPAGGSASTTAEKSIRHARRGSPPRFERLDELSLERNLSDEFVRPIRAVYRERLRHVQNRSHGEDSHRKLTELHDEIQSLLIAAERERVNELYRAGKLIDEARRRIERELDLREAHLANQRLE